VYIIMNKTILCCAVFALSTFNLSALDITTKSGKVYKNVEVTNVMPDSVGFMYTKKDGTDVLRDVELSLLTKNLQKKFKYSPKKSNVFKKRVVDFQKKRNKILQKHHQENLKLFHEQLKESKELDHIKALLHAHRIPCWIHITRSVGFNNCIGMMTTTQSASSSGGYGRLGSVYVRGINGPQNIRVSAVLYPTGETISFEDGTFPVYETNLERYALKLFKEHKTPPVESATTAKKMIFPANAPNKKK
jgi:hypothetical protein